ncbi:hypothetical protein niasHS_007840 [Heterodera schachtii]|uniref:7TM GPCR serpentine receptor class x (Srx) domain-containing protein n=1 Tax=Heterodera schachtii TaxID=97005 RepID=A0ABD2JPU7_HETSC
MSYLSGTVLLFGYIFSFFELFTYGIVLAIAFLNLAVIWPTQLLHANLKSILITQSCAVIFFVFVRSVMLVQKITFDDLFAPANVFLQHILFFNTLFRRLLGHVLIIERFLATISTNSYENFSKIGFTLTWFFITFIISFVNTVSNGQSWTFTQFNLITQTMSTVISLFEYLLIIVIRNYNRRRFISQIEEATPKNYHIGKRYQVSDNVKTATQLLPTFCRNRIHNYDAPPITEKTADHSSQKNASYESKSNWRCANKYHGNDPIRCKSNKRRR